MPEDDAAKLNLGAVGAVLVPLTGATGVLKLKDNGVEVGLPALLPRALLKEDVEDEGAGTELVGLLEIPKSNFGLVVAPVEVTAGAGAGVGAVVLPDTGAVLWASLAAGLLLYVNAEVGCWGWAADWVEDATLDDRNPPAAPDVACPSF